MMAETNDILTSATKSLYKYNSDWLVRECCRSREDYENHELYMQREFERLNQTINSQQAILQEKDTTIQQQDATIQQQDATIQQQDVTIQQQDVAIHSLNLSIQEKDTLIAQLQAQIAAQKNNILFVKTRF